MAQKANFWNARFWAARFFSALGAEPAIEAIPIVAASSLSVLNITASMDIPDVESNQPNAIDVTETYQTV